MAPLARSVVSFLALLAVSPTLAAPIRQQALSRQLAGVGAGCNSVLSSTDNGVGYGIENAEDNLAGDKNPPAGGPTTRQLAGVGAGCDSVFSSTDNGVGYGTEDVEDNLAANVQSAPHSRRQLNKIASEYRYSTCSRTQLTLLRWRTNPWRCSRCWCCCRPCRRRRQRYRYPGY